MALVASLALVGAAHAELLKFETRPDGANEAVHATVKLDGMSYDIAGTLAKPAKPPSGAKALLLETQPSEDVKPLALERGLAVLTLDFAKLPDKARAPALRDVLGHLRGALKIKRVLGRAQGSDADAMSDASSAFDGLLLHDASREPAGPTRFIASWGADAYWREKPRVEFTNAAPRTVGAFILPELPLSTDDDELRRARERAPLGPRAAGAVRCARRVDGQGRHARRLARAARRRSDAGAGSKMAENSRPAGAARGRAPRPENRRGWQ